MTVYEVVLEMDTPAGDMLNVVHYDITGTAPLDFQDFCDVIASDFDTYLKSIITAACSFRGVTIRLDTPDSVGASFVPTGGSVAGTNASNTLAPQMAALVRKQSGNLTRPTQGYAYQGGISAGGFTSAGRWSTAVNTAVKNYWDALLEVNFAGSGNAEMQIKASNPSAPNTVAYNPATLINVGGIPVTMRSRKEGVGI